MTLASVVGPVRAELSHPYAHCFARSAAKYELPPSLLPAIQKVEGGHIGLRKPNVGSAGEVRSYDHGPMQINTVWARYFAKYGIAEISLENDYCLAIDAAAYVLRWEINKAGGDFWAGVSRYHSRNPERGRQYARKVYAAAMSITARGVIN